MVTTALYEIETSEADDGTTVPAEGIWAPSNEDAGRQRIHRLQRAVRCRHRSPERRPPAPGQFVVLGYQRWADLIEAAAAYMARVHDWRHLHSYPGDDPSEAIDRLPHAVHTHAVYLRHPPACA
ncbi:hypothetical protein EDD92_9702 [Streptomyces sp. TLI_185]|nr:hypothetical protein EDD92_9702 [Streptomyces sp. TLI_185]